jgi:hypothetical protein
MLCPSRRQPPSLCNNDNNRSFTGITTYDIPGATSDYDAVGGSDDGTSYHEGMLRWAGDSLKVIDATNLVYSYTSSTSFATATDGLSNTMLIGEKHVIPAWLGDGNNGDGAVYNDDSSRWMARICGVQTNVTPNINWPLAQGPTDTSPPIPQFKFGSWHTAVCNFVFGDGSVHAISVSIDTVTLGKLALPSDGQVIPGNAF